MDRARSLRRLLWRLYDPAWPPAWLSQVAIARVGGYHPRQMSPQRSTIADEERITSATQERE